MYYNELKQLLKWLKIMKVKDCKQLIVMKEIFNLKTKSELLDFANKCIVYGLTVSDC